jgi:hypothetical protein
MSDTHMDTSWCPVCDCAIHPQACSLHADLPTPSKPPSRNSVSSRGRTSGNGVKARLAGGGIAHGTGRVRHRPVPERTHKTRATAKGKAPLNAPTSPVRPPVTHTEDERARRANDLTHDPTYDVGQSSRVQLSPLVLKVPRTGEDLAQTEAADGSAQHTVASRQVVPPRSSKGRRQRPAVQASDDASVLDVSSLNLRPYYEVQTDSSSATGSSIPARSARHALARYPFFALASSRTAFKASATLATSASTAVITPSMLISNKNSARCSKGKDGRLNITLAKVGKGKLLVPHALLKTTQKVGVTSSAIPRADLKGTEVQNEREGEQGIGGMRDENAGPVYDAMPRMPVCTRRFEEVFIPDDLRDGIHIERHTRYQDDTELSRSCVRAVSRRRGRRQETGEGWWVYMEWDVLAIPGRKTLFAHGRENKGKSTLRRL